MLPFDDILNVTEPRETSAANAAVDERLIDFTQPTEARNEPIQNVSGFTDEFIGGLSDLPDAAPGDDADINGTLLAINASLGSILDVQNEQLVAMRAQRGPASAEGINSISTSVDNGETTSNTGDSSVTQISNFVTELQSLDQTIQEVNASVSAANVNSSSSSQSTTIGNSDVSVDRSFETSTREISGIVQGQGFSLLNPRDREFLSYLSNFSTSQTANSNAVNNSAAGQSFSVNNSAMNNTIQDIKEGDMTVDRTEIDSRVNQTTNAQSNNEVTSQNLVSAFSTALAQHDQTLIQKISSTASTQSKTENTVQLSGAGETPPKQEVQNTAKPAESNQDVLAMLSQISMQLLQLNATMGSALRKTTFA